MKASDFIASAFARYGVRAAFELSGGMITHLLDSLGRAGEIPIVSVHHEQAAAFAADAAGRMGGRPSVALATSGPGATNLLTGIGSCYFDSSPAVFLTGQVNRDEQKGSRKIRQLGFQETDIVAMATPITKRAWRVERAVDLPHILEQAFALSMDGRPGPVLIDVPMDVQREAIPGEPTPLPPRQVHSCLEAAEAVEICSALRSARRPLILAGGGIRAGQAVAAFHRFLAAVQIPVVHSLMGVDLLPFEHPLNVGLIGSYGNRWANLALHHSDCLLVLGSRLDVRQTGADTTAFKADRPIFHIDCEPGEINNRVTGCRGVVSEIGPALEVLEAAAQTGSIAGDDGWQHEIVALRTRWPDSRELGDLDGINPNNLMHELSRASRQAAAYIVDVGQHQMWAAQSLELGDQQRFLTSGGMGSMGFALPASIGAALSVPGRPIVVIAGDGGFQCNLQELQTVVRLRLPLKMVILDNQCHGMVRQFQESYFERRYYSTQWGYSAPRFAHIAEAYGIAGMRISEPGEIAGGLRWLWADPHSPALLQVMIPQTANVYPKLAFGRTMDAMEPQAQPIAMEST